MHDAIIIMPVIAAVALIGLIALCIWKPIVLRVIARIFAVLASGAGVTGIVAGILFLCIGTTRPPFLKAISNRAEHRADTSDVESVSTRRRSDQIASCIEPFPHFQPTR